MDVAVSGAMPRRPITGSDGRYRLVVPAFHGRTRLCAVKESAGYPDTQALLFASGDLLQKAGLGGSYGGIKLDVPASAPALDGVHFMYDEVSKFSSLLEMTARDPNATIRQRTGSDAKQWTMRAPMLALRAPDPALALPAGTALQPTIFVRNTSAKAISANLALNWRGDSAKGQVKLPQLQLAPFPTQQLQIGTMQKQLGIPDDAHWALVTLTTSALPDDLIAIASSRDASGRYGLETRFVSGSGSHYAGGEMRADAMHDHILAVTNSEQKPAEALLTLHYDNGQKKYEMQQTIQPGSQMWIDLAQLIRQRLPDRKGNTLPADATQMTYGLEDLSSGSHSLLVSELALDTTWGHQMAPQCPECCGMTSVGFSPAFVDLPVDTGSDTVAIDGVNMCTGDGTVLTSSFSNWASENTGIAKVSYAKVQAVAVGTTTGTAYALVEVPGECGCNLAPENPVLPITVQLPTSLEVLSVTVLPNGQGLNFGCSGLANYGIMVDIKYRVLDQNGAPIQSATMTPHEKGILFSGSGYDNNIGPTGFTNSTATTAADGTFHDVPFGVCANGAFSSVYATQFITMIMPDGSTPGVRNQTFTATGQTAGHGTLSNSVSDISAKR